MNYLTLDLDNGDLVLSDNSVWKSLNTWLDGGTLYSDYYDASNCGDFWVASTHWISIDSESTYLTFTIEYEFIDASATDSCLCQIKFDGFEDGGVAVTADSSGLNISTDASKHINCDYSNANIKIDITVNLLTKEITTYIHKDNEPLAKKVNVSNYSFTEFIIQAGSRGDIVYKLPTTTKLLNVSVSDVAVSYSNFPETIDYIDKLGLARIWANIKSYISSQLLGKSDTGHTHVSSDVTDLLSDTHTWTSQQSYNSDLNLNYASTDVDDIVNSVAGSATLDNFVHMTGNETVSGIKSFPDGVIANVTGSATSATNDGSGNVISTTYGKLGAANEWTNNNFFPLTLYQKGFSPRASAPASNEFGQLSIVDTSNSAVMSINYANRTTGARDLSFRVYDSAGNINGVGVFKDSINNYSFCSIDPNKLIPLGTSTNQWKSVYAQNYYYNGVAWGLDQANVWNTYQTIKGYYLGSEQSTNGRTCLYLTSNRDTVGQSGIYITKFRQNRVQGGLQTADLHYLSFDVLENSIRTNGALQLNVTNWNNDVPSGAILYSSFTNAHLGSSLAPWKTLNGVNPGALSLPNLNYSDTNKWIDLSGNITDETGGSNEYDPTVDGWVVICAENNPTFLRVNVHAPRPSIKKYLFSATGVTIDGMMIVSAPAPAGSRVYIYFNKGSGSLTSATFITCIGNV